jgi:hypothetical protein
MSILKIESGRNKYDGETFVKGSSASLYFPCLECRDIVHIVFVAFLVCFLTPTLFILPS